MQACLSTGEPLHHSLFQECPHTVGYGPLMRGPLPMEGNGMGLARETTETDSLVSQPHSIPQCLQVHVTFRDVPGGKS